MKKIEQLTENLQAVFNDFASVFNSFVEREQRLESLHTHAVTKSKEIDRRIEMNIVA